MYVLVCFCVILKPPHFSPTQVIGFVKVVADILPKQWVAFQGESFRHVVKFFDTFLSLVGSDQVLLKSLANIRADFGDQTGSAAMVKKYNLKIDR